MKSLPRVFTRPLGLALLTLWFASPLQAQIVSLGTAPPTPATVYSAVAFDEKHHVYLQVYELGNDVYGRFLNAAGTPLGAPFSATGNHRLTFAGKPRLAYSHDDATTDDFLLLYVSDANQPGKSNTFAQRIRFTGAAPTGGALIGSWINVSPNSANPGIEQGAEDVVYNPISKQFWASYYEVAGPNRDILISRIVNGAPVAPLLNSTPGPGAWQGGSKLAVDWQLNRVFVVYFGESPIAPGALGIYGALLDGASGALLNNAIAVQPGYNVEPTVAYLPEAGGFLCGWTAFNATRDVMGRLIPSNFTGTANPSGALMATPNLNEGYPAFDYDSISRLVSVFAMRDPKFIGGALLNAVGTPITAPFNISTVSPASGSYYPAVSVAESGVLGGSYTTDYNTAWLERFQLTPAPSPGPHCCGGGGPPLGVHIQIDTPGSSQTITPPFAIGGWAVDTRQSSGPGIDVMHIWAVPQGPGAPIFVGVAPTGTARPDVGAVYGGNFTNSGYGVTLSNIPPGTYTLVFYPHSTYTGQFEFDKAVTTNVNIVGGALTAIDTPGWGQTVGGNGVGLIVAGWAIDLLNPNGTGVDAVHVWAINATTGTPTFLGSAVMGLQRTDIKNIYGAPYEFSGYGLQNTVGLAPGTYYIAVFSHSVGAPQFNVARIVGINIQ